MDALRQIDRGAAWTLLGNALNLLPALLELALIRRFGLNLWGEFLAAQAIVLLVGRISCLGLDKSMLWYLPNLAKASRGIRRPGWGAAAFAACLGSVLALLFAFPLLKMTLPKTTDFSLVRWTILAIPLFAVSEVLIGALQGVQKFHYRPLLRDLGASAFFAPIALGLSFMPLLGPKALGIGFFAGHGAIALLSGWYWAKESRGSTHGPLIPQPELFRYAMPLWLADSVNSAGLRAAVLLMARFAAPGTVAAFGIVQSIWQTANLARRAFETPLASLTASSADTPAVEHLFKKVVHRVLLWQIPLVFLASVAGGTILRLISPQLGTAQQHFGLALLIATTYSITGPALGQQVLAGLGHSPRLFYGSMLSTLLNIGLLFLLTPRWGLVGACVAQAGVALGGAALGAFQLRRYAHISPFPGSYWSIATTCLIPSAVGIALYCLKPELPWMAWAVGAVSIGLWAIFVPSRLKA